MCHEAATQSQTGAPSRTWIDSSEINVHGPRDGTNDELKGFAFSCLSIICQFIVVTGVSRVR
jgi:hypothetical protein